MKAGLEKIKNLSIIIPAYNEAKQIARLFSSLESFFVDQEPLEIIIVDDGSEDETALEIKKQVSKSSLNIKLISYSQNKGKGHAVKVGMQKAQGDFILFFDVDLSTPLVEIDNFLAEIDGHDILIGSREIKGSNLKKKQSAVRRFFGRCFSFFISFFVLRGFPDTQCGFKMYNKKSADIIAARQRIFGWTFDIEHLVIAKMHNLEIKQIPVTWENDESSSVSVGGDFPMVIVEIFRIKLNMIRVKYL
jgi:dolichyl-phosphate beta-glucosyltransferase